MPGAHLRKGALRPHYYCYNYYICWKKQQQQKAWKLIQILMKKAQTIFKVVYTFISSKPFFENINFIELYM